MTAPRQVLPDQTYMITRRCTQRQLLMRPDEETNNAFLYCLAEAAERFDIDVLFTEAMANHHHTGIHDNKGNYPEFLAHFHKLFAKHQNALHGRWENFWASEQTSVVRLVDPEDVLAKMVYALTNPVQSDLVERAAEWPGASSLQVQLAGEVLEARRPSRFFRENGSMPESVTLCITRPAGYEHLSQDEWAALLRRKIQEVERQEAERRALHGICVMGRKRILRQSPHSRPRTHEPRRQLSPRVAARNKWSRIEALQCNKRFAQEYAQARRCYAAGRRDVVFPAGTYWLTRHAAVRCGPDPTPN